ncbi:type II secretion system protein [bacterium]|nr:type II secretion system protein [bacterium]
MEKFDKKNQYNCHSELVSESIKKQTLNQVQGDRQGFTLSEVLITLGIVGVVAVLTIPGVMKNYQNRIYTAQLQKTYALIADATQAIMNDEHTDNFYETTAVGLTSCVNKATGDCQTGVGYFFTKYFKSIKKDCARADFKGCFTTADNKYQTMSGNSISGAYCPYSIQTPNGAAICGVYNTANNCMSLTVDVNGMSEPNVAGRDIFSMDIHKNGSISDYASGCADNNAGASAAECGQDDGSSGINSAAKGCLTSVVEAGWKMEY